MKETMADVAEDFKLADWNMSKATLIRMDNLLTNFTQGYYRRDGELMYRSVNALYWELYPEMDDEERKNALTMTNTLTNEYNKACNSPGNSKNLTPKLQVLLADIRLFLGDVMGNHQLLLKHQEDHTMDFMRGDD